MSNVFKIEKVSGLKFNNLTILDFSHRNTSGDIYVNCLCDCGNIKAISLGRVKNSRIKSCGCMNLILSPSDIAEVISRYNNGELSTVLCHDYGISRSGLIYILNKHNCKMHSRSYSGRKSKGHYINESKFDVITPESAYWLGFILTDGCVYNNELVFQLKGDDKEHLQKFKDFMEASQKITFDRVKNVCGFRFKSKHICDLLLSYGITPNKSFTVTVDDRLKNDSNFWRGCIDGDGTIGVYRNTPRIKLCGNHNVLIAFVNYSSQFIKSTSHISPNRSIWQKAFDGKKAYRLIEKIYKDSEVFLDRKYKKSMEILESFKRFDKYD